MKNESVHFWPDSDLKTSIGVSVHPSTVRRQLSVMGPKGCVEEDEKKKERENVCFMLKCNCELLQ